MHRLLRSGALAALTGALGCAGSSYLKAADKFATAASTSTATLQGAVDFNHQICVERSQVDYLQHRLMGTNTADGQPVQPGVDQAIYWTDWYTSFKPLIRPNTYAPSWSDKCQQMAASDALVTKLLAVLSAYAQALQAVAEDDYSGGDIGSLVTDFDALAKAIPGTPTSVTTALKSLGGSSTAPGPIGDLAGMLKQAYSAKEVSKFVQAAHPSITKILDALSAYLAAVGTDEAQWESEVAHMFRSIDARMTELPPPPPTPPPAPTQPVQEKAPEPAAKLRKGKPAKEAAALPPAPAPAPAAPAVAPRIEPGQLIEFSEFVQRWSRNLDATQAKQSAMVDAAQSLADAEKALVKAGGDDKSPDLITVLSVATKVLTDIEAIQSAVQGGAAQ